MLISFLLINMYEVYCKPIIYIRTRSGGGLFGFEYVETTFESGLDFDLVTTNCWSAGFRRCRPTLRSAEEETKLGISEEVLNKILETVELQVASGSNVGKVTLADQYVIYWNNTANDEQQTEQPHEAATRDSLKLIIYPFEEAHHLLWE